jgi:hypothetical protein
MSETGPLHAVTAWFYVMLFVVLPPGDIAPLLSHFAQQQR